MQLTARPRALRTRATLPIAVGFGSTAGHQAVAVARLAAGIAVGSTLRCAPDPVPVP